MDKILTAWTAWAAACSKNGTKALVQINHPGRQSPGRAGKRSFFTKTMAPSAVPLKMGDGLLASLITAFIFGTPRAMTHDDIRHVVSRFAATAKLASDAGFAGIEIHGAHGYLLSQFLSPDSNKRTDEYGGSAVARAKIVVEVVRAIRAVVPQDFCVGIKLNSADYGTADALADCVEQIRVISEAGIDFLEISGGTYENPTVSFGACYETTGKLVVFGCSLIGVFSMC